MDGHRHCPHFTNKGIDKSHLSPIVVELEPEFKPSFVLKVHGSSPSWSLAVTLHLRRAADRKALIYHLQIPSRHK